MLDLLRPFTEGLEAHDVSSSTPDARGGPERVVEEQSQGEKLPSSPMRGELLWQKDMKNKKKHHRFPTKKETTMRALIIRKIPIVKFVRKQKQHEPSVG